MKSESNIAEIHELCKQYGDLQVLNSVSFELEPGTVTGLIGANGAGKTTLLRIIAGITEPDSGSVRYSFPEPDPALGYLPEERGMYLNMNVKDALLFFAKLKGMTTADAKEQIKKYAQKFNLDRYLSKTVKELSKGNKQLVQLLTCILHRPLLLLLDEPFSGIDPGNAQLFTDELAHLRQQGCALLLSTHRLEETEQYCDKLLFLHKGTLADSGTPEQLKEKYAGGIHYICISALPIPATPDLPYTVLHTGVEGENFISHISCNDNILPESLLQDLSARYGVREFRKKTPSMREIYFSITQEIV